ncbi:uncharacterized protein LOC142331815 isoform X2 [Lycorma delicatula]|uniref:uncharacterized protein LOC142331815 isoform X2 n=1 Tax=Lycorma delicatula TaxID=130591 RepID=UPI003F519CD8
MSKKESGILNIPNDKIFNETCATLNLKRTEKFLLFLKNSEPSDVSHNFKIKISCLNEQLNNLLTTWELENNDSNVINKRNKIDDYLWDDNFLLKHIFENCIFYSETVSKPEFLPQLYCSICDVNFICKKENLLIHLKEKQHLNNFDKIRSVHLINNDSKILDDAKIFKFLNEKYIINEQSSKRFYCKICCIHLNNSKCNLIEHLLSDDHLKYIKGVIDFNLNFDNIELTDKIKKSIKGLVVSDDAITLEKFDFDDVNTNNNIDICTKHDEFMSELYKLFSFNKYNPIFCQPCNYYLCILDLEGKPDMIRHASDPEHKTAVDKISIIDLINYDWKFCNVCRCYIYCNNIFHKLHLNHNLHKLIQSDQNKNKNDKKNTVCEMKSDHSNVKQKICSYAIKNTDEKISASKVKGEMNDNQNNLQANVKMVINDLLKNSEVLIYKNKSVFGFYCYLCNYWCNYDDVWCDHINNNEFHKSNNCNKDNFVRMCDCKIIFFSDEEKLIEHQSSIEHFNLKSFISNKLSASDTTQEKHVDNDYIEEKNDNSDNSEGISEDFDIDSISETSSITSTVSNTSFRGSTSSLPCFYSYNKNKNRNKVAINKTNKMSKTSSFGIKGLPSVTTFNDILCAFRHLGNVKHINFLESNSANVYIDFSDKNQSTNIIGTYVMINNVKVYIEKRISLNLQLPKFVSKSFSSVPNFFNLMEDLHKKAKFLKHKKTLNRGVMEIETSIILNDIKNAISKIKSVIIIGSRATGLSCGDSLFDVFIEIGNNYFGDKNLDPFMLIRLANNISDSLRCSPSFYNIRVSNQAPIVHAGHKNCAQDCNIFFLNGIVVENTELIKTYLQFDDRITQLILIVKEWAKHTKLTATVSQYAVTWMVLYYLMKNKNPLVHPVVVLRHNNQEGRKFVAVHILM